MATNLRLSEAETEALRRWADQEGRSMQEVARMDVPDLTEVLGRRVRRRA